MVHAVQWVYTKLIRQEWILRCVAEQAENEEGKVVHIIIERKNGFSQSYVASFQRVKSVLAHGMRNQVHPLYRLFK
jgi:hypothetical protein